LDWRRPVSSRRSGVLVLYGVTPFSSLYGVLDALAYNVLSIQILRNYWERRIWVAPAVDDFGKILMRRRTITGVPSQHQDIRSTFSSVRPIGDANIQTFAVTSRVRRHGHHDQNVAQWGQPISRVPFGVPFGALFEVHVGGFYSLQFTMPFRGSHTISAFVHIWLKWTHIFAIALVLTSCRSRFQ